MITGIAGLIATLVSGLILAYFGFGTLFILSVVIGLFAIFYFRKMYEPPVKSEFHYRHSFSFEPSKWMTSFRINSTFVWFTIYMIIVSFAIAMVSPFYTVIMLKELNIGYLWYAILITINALVAIVSQPYWGRLSDRYGDRAIMIITAVMICFVPFLWLFANNVWFLMAIEIYDGFLFGGWTLVIFNFMLGIIPVDKRANYIANHSFLVGLATVSGTLVGSFLVIFFEQNTLAGIGGIGALLAISFGLRLASLAILPRIHKYYVKQEVEPLSRLAWRSIVVEPAKTVYLVAGHVYDIKWMWRKICEVFETFVRWIRQKTLWRYRLYKADRI
jgi:MFS family permease